MFIFSLAADPLVTNMLMHHRGCVAQRDGKRFQFFILFGVQQIDVKNDDQPGQQIYESLCMQCEQQHANGYQMDILLRCSHMQQRDTTDILLCVLQDEAR